MNKLHKVKAEYNKIDPMKGLLEKCFKRFDLISKGIVVVTQSSTFSGYNNASILLYRKEGYTWASNSVPNTWFELYFPYHFLEITGYAFMQEKYDDEITRAWKISCMMNNGETVLHNQPDTSIFCDGKTGMDNICGSYDKQSFPVNTVMLCNRFRITQTGPNGRPSDHFVLSGFELFGTIYYAKADICSVCRRKSFNNVLFMCLIVSN